MEINRREEKKVSERRKKKLWVSDFIDGDVGKWSQIGAKKKREIEQKKKSIKQLK